MAASQTAATVVSELKQPARRGSPIIRVAVLVLLAGGIFFAWQHFKPESPAPVPPATPTKVVAPAPVASTPLTPSETLNQLAHAPANAINQAQEAIATRRASGQARIDAASIGEDLPDPTPGSPPGSPSKPPAAAPRASSAATTTTNVSPGVTATTPMEAAAEAGAPFRSYVANAKISGVFQGNPSRAVINGRLIRSGEVVDASLGITFEGLDSERRYLIFKDRSGATVSRRF